MPLVPIFCRFEVGGSQVQNCFKLGKELTPKAHSQVKFCSDPVRSEDYFPEWKPAFKHWRFWTLRQRLDVDFTSGEGFLSIGFAVATRRQREKSCFAVVSEAWFKLLRTIKIKRNATKRPHEYCKVKAKTNGVGRGGWVAQNIGLRIIYSIL